MFFYGRNVVIEALRSNHRKNKLYFAKGLRQDQKIREITSLAHKIDIDIRSIERKELSRMTKSEEHQGVVIDMEFEYGKLSKAIESLDEEKTRSFIYISAAEYEHNIGAIARSAEVAGMSGVIIPKGTSITPTVAKASAGAVFHIPMFRESIFNALKLLQKNGSMVFGIERDGETYTDVDITGDTLFIIGAEDRSLSDQIRKECNEILEIPQFGNVNSLNMSVAASLVMFERVRQIER